MSSIDDLARNTAYFRKRLDELGFDVIGDDDSPVVPAMVYLPNTLPAFGRLCNKAGVRPPSLMFCCITSLFFRLAGIKSRRLQKFVGSMCTSNSVFRWR